MKWHNGGIMNAPLKHLSAHTLRRAELARRMGRGVAIIPTAPEHLRNRDSDYLYRYDSYFYYLTGFPEPEALLVQIAGPTPRAILFCREKHAERELWEGFRYGPEAAQERFGVDEAHSFAELDALLPKLLADQPADKTVTAISFFMESTGF